MDAQTILTNLLTSIWTVGEHEPLPLLRDQGGYIMPRERWEELKAAIDASYREIGDDGIAAYNAIPYNERISTTRGAPDSAKRGKSGHIYMIKGIGTNLYKIGITKDPKVRMKQLGTRLPFEIEVVGQFFVSDALQHERAWHDYWANRRENGEWFRLSEDDVAKFLGDYMGGQS